MGTRIVQRMGIRPSSNLTLQRRISLAVIIASAVSMGIWISGPIDLMAVCVGLILWLNAVFFAFRRPKGV
jgi:hypothetical protein